jgi:hypothetical protein
VCGYEKNGRKKLYEAANLYYTAHFARKMVGQWQFIREETKQKIAPF